MLTTEVLLKIKDSQKKLDRPKISVGDIVTVKVLIKEGSKERLQQYEGTVISKKSQDIITIRRIFQGIGIEYVFALSTPQILSIVVNRHSKIKRSKLYFLRNRVGKRAQLKNKIISITA